MSAQFMQNNEIVCADIRCQLLKRENNEQLEYDGIRSFWREGRNNWIQIIE